MSSSICGSSRGLSKNRLCTSCMVKVVGVMKGWDALLRVLHTKGKAPHRNTHHQLVRGGAEDDAVLRKGKRPERCRLQNSPLIKRCPYPRGRLRVQQMGWHFLMFHIPRSTRMGILHSLIAHGNGKLWFIWWFMVGGLEEICNGPKDVMQVVCSTGERTGTRVVIPGSNVLTPTRSSSPTKAVDATFAPSNA